MTMTSLVIVMMVRMKTNQKEGVGQRRGESRVLLRLNWGDLSEVSRNSVDHFKGVYNSVTLTAAIV